LLAKSREMLPDDTQNKSVCTSCQVEFKLMTGGDPDAALHELVDSTVNEDGLINGFEMFVAVLTTRDPSEHPMNKSYMDKLYQTRQEIADRIGIGKTAVSGHLKALKIKEKHTGRDQNNYKFPNNPPYGFKVIDGKLVQNPREIKMARMIIQLKDREGLIWPKVIERMNAQGLKSRIGEWTINSARNARLRWRGKL
jgi:biotin operon repressor